MVKTPEISDKNKEDESKSSHDQIKGKEQIDIQKETHELTNVLKEDLRNIEERNDRDEAEKFMSELLSSGKKEPIGGEHRTEFLFSEIATEHVRYEYIKKIFPLFVAKCESSRLGKNPLLDVAGIGIGIVESSIQIADFVVDTLINTLQFLRNPIKEYDRTRDALKNTIV